MASVPYDAEGVATRDRDVVSGGKLQGYILSSYSARRLGLDGSETFDITGLEGGLTPRMDVACRIARASALKAASATW